MGWKFKKEYLTNPAGNGEEKDIFKVEVSGNSISNTICFESCSESVVMEIGTLEDIVADLKFKGILSD